MTTNSDQKNFTYDYKITPDGVELNVNFSGGISDTSQLPDIYSKVFAYLPSLLLNKCFNERRIPFREEIAKTELGHLLEHILLENMCILKHKSMKDGFVSISGRTFWNTQHLPVQKFTIKIYCSLVDVPLFFKVMNPSFEFMGLLCRDLQSRTNGSLQYVAQKQIKVGERSGLSAPSRDNVSVSLN